MRSFLLAVGLGAVAVACGDAGDDTDGQSSDISGSVSAARACEVKKNFTVAGIEAFTSITKSDLPTGVPASNPLSLSKVAMGTLGYVFVVEEASSTSFYDGFAALLARKTSDEKWTAPSGATLHCPGDVPDPPPPPPPPSPVMQLASGDNLTLLGVANERAIYKKNPRDAASSEGAAIYEVRLDGTGPQHKLFDLHANDFVTVTKEVVGHWRDVQNGIGRLNVWSADGLRHNVADQSAIGLLRSQPSVGHGARIVYSTRATVSNGRPALTAVELRDLSSYSAPFAIDAADRIDLAALSCPIQASFSGGTLFLEYCREASPTARLVAFRQTGYAFEQLGADLDGKVSFAADRAGRVVVAAKPNDGTELGEQYGRVFTVGETGSTKIDGASKYLMTPDGSRVIYITPRKELRAQKTNGGPALMRGDNVAEILGLSPDGNLVAFSHEPLGTSRTSDVNVVPTSYSTLPAATVVSPRAVMYGFSPDSSRVLLLEQGPSAGRMQLRTASLSGGTSQVVMADAIGGRLLGHGFLGFSNPRTNSAGTVGEMGWLSSLDSSSKLPLATDVPIKPSFELFPVGDNRAVYTDLASGKAGLYVVTVP